MADRVTVTFKVNPSQMATIVAALEGHLENLLAQYRDKTSIPSEKAMARAEILKVRGLLGQLGSRSLYAADQAVVETTVTEG